MKVLLRAVITGFGFSLGAAVFKKVRKQLGLDDDEEKPAKTPNGGAVT